MISIDQYFDELGLLTMRPDSNGVRDGGDTAERIGLLRFGKYIKYRNDPDNLSREQAKYNQECDYLEVPGKPGYYVRHPDKSRWWSNPTNFSRDQTRPLVMALGALGLKARLARLTWEHIKRFGFYQNNRKHNDPTKFNFPDVTSPDHAGEFIRAWNMAGFKFVWILYPLLLLTDLAALIGLASNFFQWKDPEEADDDLLIMHVLQAKFSMPTPISYLVRKLYKNYRQRAGKYRIEMNDMTGPETALAWKQRYESGAPPMYENLYREIMKEHL